jgi:Putative MetA-pathway of phenol degradation
MTCWAGAAALVAGLLVASGNAVWAQSVAELVTDRPDETESAVTVPRGGTQLEFGARWLVERSSDARLGIVEVPGTLVRFGAWDRVELRLAWGGWVGTSIDGSRQRQRADGFADPEVGVKWAIVPPGEGGTEVALLGHLTLPAGNEIVGAPAVDPSARLTVAHSLGERASLGWNVGYEARSIDGGTNAGTRRLGRWIYSASLGFDVSPRWGAFVESFGDLPANDPGPAVHALDGGVTRLIASRVQLDMSVGVGLSDEAPDRFFGVGLSFRLPR